MDVERITLKPGAVLGARERVRPEAMGEFFGRAMERSSRALHENGINPVGPPTAVYRGDPENAFDVTAGFPVPSTIQVPPGFDLTELPPGEAVTTIHVGSYDSMTETYGRLSAWRRDQHLTPAEPMWEEYLTDPAGSPDPATWRTRIVFRVT